MAKTIRTVILLPAFPAVTQLLFLLPIVAGLFGVLLPAFGYLPELGGNKINFEVFEWNLIEFGFGKLDWLIRPKELN